MVDGFTYWLRFVIECLLLGLFLGLLLHTIV